MPQQADLTQLLDATERLIAKYQPADPAMVAVSALLKQWAGGVDPATLPIGRLIMYEIEPAPNAEIQQWAESVLTAWHRARESGGQRDGQG